jgi:hypothetical protein
MLGRYYLSFSRGGKDGINMRTTYEIDETIVGKEFKEGSLGVRRFVRILQDILDGEGIPLDVKIVRNTHNKKNVNWRHHILVHDWVWKEADQLYNEDPSC